MFLYFLHNPALVNASNKVRIGSTAVTVIEGEVAYTVSDGRFKRNVNPGGVPGLDFITQLQPVTYRFDYPAFSQFLGEKSVDKAVLQQKAQQTEMGFVAQDLERTMREHGIEVTNLLHSPNHELDNYSIAYGQLVVPLVKAVQELASRVGGQQAIIAEQQKEIATLQAKLDEVELLKARMAKLEAMLLQKN